MRVVGTDLQVHTVSFIDLKEAGTQLQLPGPVGLWLAAQQPTAVVPGTIGLGVHPQAALQEAQFCLHQSGQLLGGPAPRGEWESGPSNTQLLLTPDFLHPSSTALCLCLWLPHSLLLLDPGRAGVGLGPSSWGPEALHTSGPPAAGALLFDSSRGWQSQGWLPESGLSVPALTHPAHQPGAEKMGSRVRDHTILPPLG